MPPRGYPTGGLWAYSGTDRTVLMTIQCESSHDAPAHRVFNDIILKFGLSVPDMELFVNVPPREKRDRVRLSVNRQ